MKAASASSKIVSRPKLLRIVSEWRKQGETISFTNGVFDLLHRGHVYSLETAAGYGKRLVVGVNSDRSARRLNKGSGRPVKTEHDRVACVAAMAVVDLVVLFDEDTPYELLSELKPEVLVKGDDYRIDEVVGREFAERVELIRRLEGFSTSSIYDRLNE